MGIFDTFDGSGISEESSLAHKNDSEFNDKLAAIYDRHAQWLNHRKITISSEPRWSIDLVEDFIDDIIVTAPLIEVASYQCDPEIRKCHNWAYFFTGLLRKAYDQGENDFTLHLQKFGKSGVFGLDGLASYLWANKDNPLKLTTHGYVGYGFGRYSKSLDVTIDSAGRYCMEGATDFRATVYHDVDYGVGGSNGKYFSPNKKLLLRLCSGWNEVYLIHPDGSTQKMSYEELDDGDF